MRPFLGSRSEWEQDDVSEGLTFAIGTEKGYNGRELFDGSDAGKPDCAEYAPGASRREISQIPFSLELNCLQ